MLIAALLQQKQVKQKMSKTLPFVRLLLPHHQNSGESTRANLYFRRIFRALPPFFRTFLIKDEAVSQCRLRRVA
ncbi:MAG: hypothetical protein EGQ76_07805 [Sutterella sp.]|nr:hypothetical protein [Sutterella sp.]